MGDILGLDGRLKVTQNRSGKQRLQLIEHATHIPLNPYWIKANCNWNNTVKCWWCKVFLLGVTMSSFNINLASLISNSSLTQRMLSPFYISCLLGCSTLHVRFLFLGLYYDVNIYTTQHTTWNN
jgi:hypothetical protein